jgi:hypothetical protein
MDSREALTFVRPDRVPVLHCTLKGAWRAHGEALLETLLDRRYECRV